MISMFLTNNPSSGDINLTNFKMFKFLSLMIQNTVVAILGRYLNYDIFSVLWENKL